MSTNDHTARTESWEALTQWAASQHPAADCILELRARVERLEQAQQQQPAPPAPAGRGELVRSVAATILDAPSTDDTNDWTPEARAAILTVADYLELQAWRGAADALRREVGR
jgi:hypothetical protein